MCAFTDFCMYQDSFDTLTGIESVTVEYSTESGNYVLTGLEFRPITPRVVHVYHDGRYLGDVIADDEREFDAGLVDLIEEKF